MVSIARERTQAARFCMLRAMQLKGDETAYKEKLPSHCLDVLKTKKLLLFDDMVKSCGYADVGIARDILYGFDLMGGLPKSNVFAQKRPLELSFLNMSGWLVLQPKRQSSILRDVSTTLKLRMKSAGSRRRRSAKNDSRGHYLLEICLKRHS